MDITTHMQNLAIEWSIFFVIVLPAAIGFVVACLEEKWVPVLISYVASLFAVALVCGIFLGNMS